VVAADRELGKFPKTPFSEHFFESRSKRRMKVWAGPLFAFCSYATGRRKSPSYLVKQAVSLTRAAAD
jgi:hypothetical protein